MSKKGQSEKKQTMEQNTKEEKRSICKNGQNIFKNYQNEHQEMKNFFFCNFEK